MNECPQLDQLRRLLHEEIVGDAPSEVQGHLESCLHCQQTLERLAAAGPSWDRAARLLGTLEEPTAPALAVAVEKLQSEVSAVDTEAELRTPTPDEFPFLEPATARDQLGRLGHYAILDVVGRGGMGVVFKARDERLNRTVAVKVLGPQYAASASARKRFEREAKATAAISHDHAVPIYSVEEVRGVPYLVMPFIPGKSLQECIDQRGALPLTEVLHIGAQIAAGLAAAHKRGLIHRDIKPANILLEPFANRDRSIAEKLYAGGPRPLAPPPPSLMHVRITDFGLARAVDDASVTQSGVITGTPMFMSPEQARGDEAIDGRSDLFSLGSVLYMMATGRPPFGATGAHAVIHRVIHDAPRPMRSINPEIPEWLESIVAKLHAKHPGDRFANADQVAELLAQHLAHLHDPSTAPRPAQVQAPVTRMVQPAGAWSRASAIVAIVFGLAGCSVTLFVCAAFVFLMWLGVITVRLPEQRPPVMRDTGKPVEIRGDEMKDLP